MNCAVLLDKKRAIECFKKALEIKPTYKMAKNNLRITKNATKEDQAYQPAAKQLQEGDEILSADGSMQIGSRPDHNTKTFYKKYISSQFIIQK